jgi:hypothetical protein
MQSSFSPHVFMWVKGSSGNAPRDRPTVGGFAADRGTAAAATTSASASRPMVWAICCLIVAMHYRANFTWM